MGSTERTVSPQFSSPGDHAYVERLRRRADALLTACVHAGDAHANPTSNALDPPLVLSAAFGFDSAEHAAAAFRGDDQAYIYGRWGNPTVDALEEKLRVLERAEAACVTASGMAAISGTVLSFCEQGSHIVAPRSMYAESARLLRERLPRFGITTTFVDAPEPGAYEAAIRPETRLLYLETPANPTLRVTDVRAITALARSRGIVTVVDNTFATPFCQTPIPLGADVVVHSMTKALGGHGDAIGGFVASNTAHIARIRDLVVKGFGGVLAPFNAYLVARGLRTFPLRQRQACESAARLATLLEEHPEVERVYHPSLASHPHHALANEQMEAFGSMLSFEVRPSRAASALERGRRVLEAVKVVSHAVSLGDVRSLIVHPASTTHSTMPPDARRLADISDGLLRMSVGLESAQDLWEDLEQALGRA